MTFKVRLLLGAAAPLVFTVPAFAQVTISTATTTPVATNTANNGAASDVTIASGGSVTVTGAGSTAVTINSNNNVTNAGTIATNNADNSTGVRILSTSTGSFSSSGSINVLEDYTRADSDSDGNLDGVLAQGTGRIGVLVEPGGTFAGNVAFNLTTGTNPTAGSIAVEGNNSFGVSIQSNLAGNYIQNGNVSVTGDNSVGVDLRGDIAGNVEVGAEKFKTSTSVVSSSGGITVVGANAVGLRVSGDVGGEFVIDGAISSTGFGQGSTQSNYEDPDLADDNNTGTDEPAPLDPDDLLPNGAAVEIRGDLARGFLVNGGAVGGVDPTDDIKDVVQDFNDNRATGSIITLGSAPALLIQSVDGAAGDAIVFGQVSETIRDSLDDDGDSNVTEVLKTFNYDYGFMNRGQIISNGVNTGFSSTGVKIAGSADGTHTTTIQGGIFNGGAISGRAFEADAIGLQIGSGASTPQIVNAGGTIRADVNTETTHDSYGIRIEAGANVSSLVNSGNLGATMRGFDGSAFAFQDLSGTVTTVNNSALISAGFIDDDSTDDITSGLGRAVALDLSHNTTGVLVTQSDTIDNAKMFGDILFGSGSDTLNLLSGVANSNVEFGTGSDTLVVNSATLTGDAAFAGAGANVSLVGGTMTGDLSLGNAAGALSFTGGSTFNGAISRTGAAAMTLAVDNSTVNNSGAGTLNLSSATLSNNARVGLVIDNARIAGNTPIYNVVGTLDIAANTRFTPIFQQFNDQPFTLRVIDAGTINLGGSIADMLSEDGPFLYNMQLVQPNANAIDLVLNVKTASQLGLNTRQASAYGAVLDLMEANDTVAAGISSISTQAAFQRGWADLLPASDVSVMQVLASNATAAFGATANRLDMISAKPNAPGGAWTEEFGVYHKSDASADTSEISGGGFGVAAGVDLISTGTALIGTYLSLESAELEEEGRTGAPLNVAQTTIGGYAGWTNGNLALNGTASYGFVNFTSDRRVTLGSLSDRLKADWNGSSYSAALRATYKVPLGFLDLKPFVGVDYVGFQQDSYTETAETEDGLAIVAGDADASLATASYGLQLIGNFGGDDSFTMRPTASIGYRNVLNWENTPALLRFADSPAGSTFTATPGIEPEDALTAGLGLNIDSEFLNIKIGYDAELADTQMTHYGSITFRLAFW